MLTTGYDGPLSLEVFNDVYRQADPRHAAIDGMRSLLALQEAVGARGPPAVRERLRPSGLPPAPRLGGHVFTELAVDDVSGPVVARALTALGFAHTGQHRSKPVQLWQQGSGPDPAELRATKDGPARDGGDLRAGRSRAPTRPGRPSGPNGCSPRCCRACASPRRPT